jgi:cytoskeletal protein CcmA (bactofilin family)
MAIFRRDSASSPASPGVSSDTSSSQSSHASSAQRRRVTHIAPGTRVEGQLAGPTELLIEGEVDGEIRIDASVMIGTEGVVQGPVFAQVVRVGGRVMGNVTATERVEVAPSGSLEGDIAAPRVIIAEGAFFKGRVEMKPDKPNRPDRPDNRDRMDRDRAAGDPRRNKGDAGPAQKAPAESGT